MFISYSNKIWNGVDHLTSGGSNKRMLISTRPTSICAVAGLISNPASAMVELFSNNVCLMISVVILYFCYIFDLQIGFKAVNCDNYASETLCMIAVGIVNWLLIVQLVFLGTLFTLLVSTGMKQLHVHVQGGNNNQKHQVVLAELAVGVSSGIIFMILSIFYPIHAALLMVLRTSYR